LVGERDARESPVGSLSTKPHVLRRCAVLFDRRMSITQSATLTPVYKISRRRKRAPRQASLMTPASIAT